MFTVFIGQCALIKKVSLMCVIGIIVGVGVGLTRDCSTIMVAQYFKKNRELVEMITVAGSGLGIVCMSTYFKRSIDAFGWR